MSEEFYSHVKNILKIINTKNVNIMDPLTEENLNNIVDKYKGIWKKCLISNSYQPDDSKNLERLEFYGDKVLSNILGRFIMSRFSNQPLEKLTPIKNYLESNNFNSESAKFLEIDKFIIYDERIDLTEALIADSFEAFLGCLDFTFTREFKIGSTEFCCKLYAHVYENVFDENKLIIADKTEITQQLKEQISFNTHEETRNGNYNITVTIRTTDKISIFNEFLKFFNINKTLKSGEILGKHTSKSKKESQNIASSNALKYLNELGYSKDRMFIYQITLWDEFIINKNIKKLLEEYLSKNNFIGYSVIKQTKWSDNNSGDEGCEIITAKINDFLECKYYQLWVGKASHNNFKTDSLTKFSKDVKYNKVQIRFMKTIQL